MGTKVRVDPVRHIATEGMVSVIDLRANRLVAEIAVEFHASALAVTPDGKYVACANAGSDTISVIDTKIDKVVERIWTREPSDLFSASPNALAFDKSGRWLMVCNGTQNAVGVIKFDPADRESSLLGLVPVGWYPGGVVYDPGHKQLCVANIKGLGSKRVIKPGEKPRKPAEDGENSHELFGSPFARADTG
jgi:YVTN family beta-propeller protein